MTEARCQYTSFAGSEKSSKNKGKRERFLLDLRIKQKKRNNILKNGIPIRGIKTTIGTF